MTGPAAHAQTAYSIGTTLVAGQNQDYYNTLFRYDVSSPGTPTVVGKFSGAVTRLDGLDYRASDGLVYGYSVGDSRTAPSLVTVDMNTAVTTLVSHPTINGTSPAMGIDFDPVTGRLRSVDANGQNLSVVAETGAATPEGRLRYAAGDVNAALTPAIDEAAYTNNFVGASNTALYYIDFRTDTLVTSSDPASGLVTTVGSLGVDTNGLIGFDIYSPSPNVNIAYASMSLVNGPIGFFTIDLQTGAASLIGSFPQSYNLSGAIGLAIVPPGASVAAPEPASLALLAPLLPLVGVIRRRRKQSP